MAHQNPEHAPETAVESRPGTRHPGRTVDWTGDQGAWLEIGETVVDRLARRYQRTGLPHEDLRSAGRLGVVEAARRFDPSRGVAFATYATWWVRKQMLDAVHGQARAVTATRYRVALERRLADADRLLRSTGRDEPPITELASRASLSVEVAERVRRERVRVRSLDEPDHVTGVPAAERLVDPDAADALDTVIRTEVRDRVRMWLARVPERERTILALRYGLDGEGPLSSRKVGDRVGLSRERVRQIESRWLAWLRRRIAVPPPRDDA